MELRQLRYFVAVVDCGSLSRAASMVHIVQSALSQQMAQLEAELGVRLLQRSVKGVAPTDAGLALYRHAQQVLRLVSDTKEVVRASGQELSGRVKLGLPSSIAMILVGPLVAELEKRYPQIVLEVYESPSAYLAAHLINQHVDLSVLVDETVLAGIEAEPLVDEVLYFVQPRKKPLVRHTRTIELARLADVPLLLTTHATTLRLLVDRAFERAGTTPCVKAEASSVQTVLAMVAQGSAGTIVPYSALAWHAAAQWLRHSQLEPRVVRRASLALSRLNQLSPSAKAVLVVIRGVVRDLVRECHWKGAELVVAG